MTDYRIAIAIMRAAGRTHVPVAITDLEALLNGQVAEALPHQGRQGHQDADPQVGVAEDRRKETTSPSL